MSNDQRVIKTIDDFLSAALEVDSGAPPTTLERAFAALTGPEAVAVLRSAVPDAVEGLLGALPATTHTLGRVCALAATMRPGVLAAAVWARAADATLAEGVPAHLLAALPAVCAITERRVRTALTARPRSARALCTTAALVEGVLARLGAAGFDAATLTPLHPAALALRLAAGDVCGALPLAQRAASFVRAAAPQQHAAAVSHARHARAATVRAPKRGVVCVAVMSRGAAGTAGHATARAAVCVAARVRGRSEGVALKEARYVPPGRFVRVCRVACARAHAPGARVRVPGEIVPLRPTGAVPPSATLATAPAHVPTASRFDTFRATSTVPSGPRSNVPSYGRSSSPTSPKTHLPST